MKRIIAKKLFKFGYWFIYFASLVDGYTTVDMWAFVTKKITKKCSWCEIAGIPDDENRFPINEVGAYDSSTGWWICKDCYDAARSS